MATSTHRNTVALGAASLALAIVLPYVLNRVAHKKRRSAITADASAVAASAPASSLPAFNESLAAFPQYDVVIVGGGTAGCVLAARLSENPNIKVLLLEAGTSGVAQLFTRIPLTYGRLFPTEHDWHIRTEAQPHAADRKLFWPRGKLLGGCSSVNALMFHFGTPSDYDEWARVAGSDEWSWKNLKQYFLKFEHYNENPEFPVDVSKRGSTGPVQTGFFGNNSLWGKAFVQSCIRIGIPPRVDFNTDDGTLGTGKIMTYIDKRGRRSSTESAYFTPEVLARPNLTVLTGAHVTRIILAQDHTTGVKRAVGVEFSTGSSGSRYRVRAGKEVVLAAGAVHTPHILMVSGIGPAEHLTTHGVPVLHDLPGVGQNLYDHGVVNLHFRADPKASLYHLAKRGAPGFTALKELLKWQLYGAGPMRCNVAESVAFFRSDDPTLFPREQFADDIEDTTSSPGAPDVELCACPITYKDHGYSIGPVGSSCSLTCVLLRPTSTGTVSLQSNDPFVAPVIDPNYLATAHDVAVLKRAVRVLLRIAQAEPISSVISKGSHVLPALDEKLGPVGDDVVEKIVRERIDTLYHPTSSARMAPLEQGGAVDPHLLVYGIAGLRICDASIFPTINSGHTAAPVIAIAEKAADLIKAQF